MKMLRATLMLLVCLGVLSLTACGSTTAVPWQGYARLWNTPKDYRPFLIIKCKYSDVPNVPSGLDTQINKFLTLGGVGTGNMLDYYSDVSYGAVSLAGDRVIGWYTAPFPHTTTEGRTTRVNQCANAVPPDDIDFSAYYGIIMVTNTLSDGGACYDGQQPMTIHNQTYPMACVVFDNFSLFAAFAAHEIGHGLGMPHSYDNGQGTCGSSKTPGEYCDQWDIMSALNTHQFVGANFPNPYDKPNSAPNNSDGPGLDVPNLIQMGWMPQLLPAYHALTAPQTFKLAALSHPKAPGVLAVKIYPTASNQGDFYTVEYRQQDGWDAGIPENTVLIHQFKSGPASKGAPYSYLQENSNPIPGELRPGMSWTNPTHFIQVCVVNIDPSSATATIRVGVPSPFCSSGPRVKILAPPNGTHVNAGAPFQLSASATSFGGTPLPDSQVRWQANGKYLGSGKTLATSLGSAGTYTITVTASDPSDGGSATDKITLVVDPVAPPPAKPTVKILSPTNGEYYSVSGFTGSLTVVLSSQASAGVTTYLWSDSLHLFTDNKANDTLTLTPSSVQLPCANTGISDVVTLKVTDNLGQTATDSRTISIQRICIN